MIKFIFEQNAVSAFFLRSKKYMCKKDDVIELHNPTHKELVLLGEMGFSIFIEEVVSEEAKPEVVSEEVKAEAKAENVITPVKKIHGNTKHKPRAR